MPTLKNLTCQVQWGDTNVPFREYGTYYGDGVVETFIAIPDRPQTFNILLTSKGYISEGLCVAVFTDDDYQCNRTRVNLVPPKAGLSRERTEVKFLLRQKEKPMGDGVYMGREWRFDHHNIVPQLPTGIGDSHFDDLGTIKVLVFRCTSTDPSRRSPSPCSSTAESDFFGERADVEIRNNTQHSIDRNKIAMDKSDNAEPLNHTEQDDGVFMSGMFDGAYDYPPHYPLYEYGPPANEWQRHQDGLYANEYAAYPRANESEYLNGTYPAYSMKYTSVPAPPPPEYVRNRPRKHVRFEDGSTPNTEADAQRKDSNVNHKNQNTEAHSPAEHDWSDSSPHRTNANTEHQNTNEHQPGHFDRSAGETKHNSNYQDDERYNDYLEHTASHLVHPLIHPSYHPPPYFPGPIHAAPTLGPQVQQPMPPMYYYRSSAFPPPIAQPSWAKVPAPYVPTQPRGWNPYYNGFGNAWSVPPHMRTQHHFFTPPGHLNEGSSVYQRSNATPGSRGRNENGQERCDSQGTGNANTTENNDQNGDNTQNESSWDDPTPAKNTSSNDDGWNTSNETQNQADNQDWKNEASNNNASDANDNQVSSSWDHQPQQNQQSQDTWAKSDNSNDIKAWNNTNNNNNDATNQDTQKTPQNNGTNDWNDMHNTNHDKPTPAMAGNDPNSFQSATSDARSLYGPHGAYYTSKHSEVEVTRPDAEEEPRFDVPQSIVDVTGSTMQVQPGRGFLYTKKSYCPCYLDSIEEPYARFVFKYRTNDQLQKELDIELEAHPSGNEEVQALQDMDKNALIDMFLRAKNALGGQIPEAAAQPPASRTESGPTPVDPPLQDFLKYKLPPQRSASIGVRSGTANTGFDAPPKNDRHTSANNGTNNGQSNQETSTNIEW